MKSNMWTIAIVSASILGGCGGSGGGGASASISPPAPVTYTLGAQISGLTSDGLILLLSGTQYRPLAGATTQTFGSFSSGTSYAVSVQTQPAGLTCTIDKPSATLSTNTSMGVNCVASGSTSNAADLTHLVVGSALNILKRSSGQTPSAGALWLCGVPTDGAGAKPSNDWLNADGTWDLTRKPYVKGDVSWESVMNIAQSGSKRIITGNGLPNHVTGAFPILQSVSPEAWAYDKNPSSAKSQNVNLTFDVLPVASNSPNCVPFGATGILLTGSAFYHGSSTLGTDAAAYEMLDDYGGHSDGTGTYHYHFLTPKLQAKLDSGTTGHSALTGYAMDGYGIFGPRGDDGKNVKNSDLDECHGHTHMVQWDGQLISMYHYHWTYDFPYNVGCYKSVPIVPWNGR